MGLEESCEITWGRFWIKSPSYVLDLAWGEYWEPGGAFKKLEEETNADWWTTNGYGIKNMLERCTWKESIMRI